MKAKKITLSHGWNNLQPKSPSYRVEQVENSVAYAPHQFLTESDVRGLCSNSNWRVIIKAKSA